MADIEEILEEERAGVDASGTSAMIGPATVTGSEAELPQPIPARAATELRTGLATKPVPKPRTYIDDYRDSVRRAGEDYGQAKHDYLGYFSGLVDDLKGRYDKATRETEEAKKAHAKSQRINALGEGLSAIANLWTTVKGATPMRLPSPTQQAQRRFDYDQAKRDREREKYERLVRAAEEGRANTLFGLAGQDYKNALENAGNILGANQERERLAAKAEAEAARLAFEQEKWEAENTRENAVANSEIKKNNAAAKKSEADANAKASGESGVKHRYIPPLIVLSTGERLPLTDESMERVMNTLGQTLYERESARIDEEIQALGGVKKRNSEKGRIRANRDEVSDLLERKKALETVLLAGSQGGEERLEALRAWLTQNMEKHPDLMNALREASRYDALNNGIAPSTYYIMDSATPAREGSDAGQGGEDDEFPDMKVNRYSNQFINY